MSFNTLERAAAAYAGQVELIGRSDNAISETLTFGLTNAKQIGKTLGAWCRTSMSNICHNPCSENGGKGRQDAAGCGEQGHHEGRA